jgi:chromosome segregation ATPase
MANPISFRPTKETLKIFNEREEIYPDFDKTMIINRSITFFFSNVDKMRGLEIENRSHEQMIKSHEFALNVTFQKKREAFEKELKTANDKIEELRIQSSKHQADVEILKSKNNFLRTQASVLDKKALNELETLRAKVAEQEKEVFSLTAKVGCYENEYLNKAFAEVKGTKLMIQDGKVNETFTIGAKFELVMALSRRYYLHLFKE